MGLIDWDINHWIEKENGHWINETDSEFNFDLKAITAKTFDVTAEKWAKVIANADRGVEKHQLRNFYDKILELEEKVNNLNGNEEEFAVKILPFVKMLNSKVTYARQKQRGAVNQAFEKFMRYSIAQIDDMTSFSNFKYLFESVIGFYQKEIPHRNIFFLKQNKENYNKRKNRNRHNQQGRRQ